MWNDELYTYYIAHLPTMRDVWAALMSRGEQTPPFFYVITRLSLRVFGDNNLALRLPEMLGFWVMIVCLFVFVARRASPFSALCAMVFPLVSIAYRFAFEARPYALVLGFGAIALLSWQTVTSGRLRALGLVALTLSVAATFSTHYYGIMVMLPLALGELVRTLNRRRVDVAVWAAFTVCAGAAGVAAPVDPGGHRVCRGLLVAAAVGQHAGLLHSTCFTRCWCRWPRSSFSRGLIGWSQRRREDIAGTRVSPPVHEIAAACGFIVIPIVCVVLAKVATGAFTNRYALPAIVGFAVLGGFSAAVAFTSSARMGLVAVMCLIGWFGLSQTREWRQPTELFDAGQQCRTSTASIDCFDPTRNDSSRSSLPTRITSRSCRTTRRPRSGRAWCILPIRSSR